MTRKADDLRSLMRLQSWAVDERRRELGVLLAREEGLLRQGEEMDRQLLREQDAARADPAFAGHTYAIYAEYHGRQRKQLDLFVAQIRVQIEQARDNLADAYREQKVLEEVRNARRKQERVDQLRQEQIFFDEVAQTQFSRAGR
jgi:flagellar biosynthesis chaperone FliJ